MLPMSGRSAIWVSAALATVVAFAAYFYAGADKAALAFTARNTARFSGLVFALALVARSPRMAPLFAQRWPLFWAFIAAHGVHFLSVLAIIIFDPTHPLRASLLRLAITLAVGYGIVLASAMTAGPADAPFHSCAHTALFYVVALLFVVAFVSGVRSTHPLSIFNLVVLVLALSARAIPAKQAASAGV